MITPAEAVERRKTSQRAYYLKNKALILERSRQRYQRVGKPAQTVEQKTIKNAQARARWASATREQRDRINVARKERAKKDPAGHTAAYRRKHLQLKYGLTLDSYAELLAKQNGRCALCRGLPTSKRLAVDHCHKTGVIRGLLCDRCNRGIGLLDDSAVRLRQAADYIESAAHIFEGTPALAAVQ